MNGKEYKCPYAHLRPSLSILARAITVDWLSRELDHSKSPSQIALQESVVLSSWGKSNISEAHSASRSQGPKLQMVLPSAHAQHYKKDLVTLKKWL